MQQTNKQQQNAMKHQIKSLRTIKEINIAIYATFNVYNYQMLNLCVEYFHNCLIINDGEMHLKRLIS